MTSPARTRAFAVLLSLAVPVGIGVTASSATAGADTFRTVVTVSHAKLQACKSKSGGKYTVDLRVKNTGGDETAKAQVDVEHGSKSTARYKSGPVKAGETSRIGSVQFPAGKSGYQLSFTVKVGNAGAAGATTIADIRHC